MGSCFEEAEGCPEGAIFTVGLEGVRDWIELLLLLGIVVSCIFVTVVATVSVGVAAVSSVLSIPGY